MDRGNGERMAEERTGAAVGEYRRSRLPRRPAERRPVAVVIDSHTAFADLLAAMIAGPLGIEVAATATSVADARRACSMSLPDLVVLNPDLDDGCGLALLAEWACATRIPRVVVIANRTSRERIHTRSRLGGDPVHAVVGIDDGARGVTGAINGALAALGHDTTNQRVERTLSQRETDVFRRIGRGLSTAAMAEELGISRQTVETHRKSITKKLGLTGAGLVRSAVFYEAAAPAGTTRPA
jgi:DNA-binding NarL/FixJ family response regulator